MAMDHISCFTLETHPVKSDEPYSQFLLNSGACDAVFTLSDIALKIRNRESWHNKQKNAKKGFIQNYMYKFDGKSSERLRTILMEDETV
jgi:hypothetical protein